MQYPLVMTSSQWGISRRCRIDPKVVMDLPIFKIGGWNILQPSSRKLLEESIEEDELQLLLIGSLSRYSFFVMHCVKELMLLCEGTHEMMQCHKRQHFAASNDLHEYPIGYSSWRESTRREFIKIQMESSQMRSESSEYMSKTKAILIPLESYFGKYAQEVWEKHRMDPDMHLMLFDTKLMKATLLNMYNPILMGTIMNALREQSKKDDQMKTAGEITSSVPETSLDWESILKGRGGFWE